MYSNVNVENNIYLEKISNDPFTYLQNPLLYFSLINIVYIVYTSLATICQDDIPARIFPTRVTCHDEK